MSVILKELIVPDLFKSKPKASRDHAPAIHGSKVAYGVYLERIDDLRYEIGRRITNNIEGLLDQLDGYHKNQELNITLLIQISDVSREYKLIADDARVHKEHGLISTEEHTGVPDYVYNRVTELIHELQNI